MSLKHRFQSALQKKARKGFRGYPIATIAYYGPDDTRASKVAVGIVTRKQGDVATIQRWLSTTEDVRFSPSINEQILKFVRDQEVRSVIITDRIVGCPHEEGVDYPEGEVCPQCPYWAQRDRWTGELMEGES